MVLSIRTMPWPLIPFDLPLFIFEASTSRKTRPYSQLLDMDWKLAQRLSLNFGNRFEGDLRSAYSYTVKPSMISLSLKS
jgi:hypothetical protein